MEIFSLGSKEAFRVGPGNLLPPRWDAEEAGMELSEEVGLDGTTSRAGGEEQRPQPEPGQAVTG